MNFLRHCHATGNLRFCWKRGAKRRCRRQRFRQRASHAAFREALQANLKWVRGGDLGFETKQ